MGEFQRKGDGGMQARTMEKMRKREAGGLMKSRMTELLFATGIPLAGFMGSAASAADLQRLLWFLPVLLAAGWHVISVNDRFFRPERARSGKLGESSTFISFFLVPPAVGFTLMNAGMFAAFVVMLLIILNWDIYSISGKRGWLSGLAHNFAGGGLHYLLGAAAASQSFTQRTWAEAVFFALAMTCGAMHHDAADFPEDLVNGYETGAVKFGYERWWQLGIVPMALSLLFLYCAEREFAVCFGLACTAYFTAYIAFSSGALGGLQYALFRKACRIIFAFCGLAYVGIKAMPLFLL